MATLTARSVAATAARQETGRVVICHFTTAHTELKSRSFHRQFQPLAARGFAVRYVTSVSRKLAESRDGVDFATTPGRSRLQRLLALPFLLVRLLRQDAALYHFQDPELLPLALALKLIFRKRVVYDAYEDFPSLVAQKRSLPPWLRTVAAGTLVRLEGLAALCLDGVMTADPFTLRRLSRIGSSRKLVFYNFPNLDFFPPPRPRPKRFDLVYRGGLSERTGTHDLLDALRRLHTGGRDTRLLLIGYFDDAASERHLRERIHALGLDSSVEVCGRIDHEAMAGALAQAHIGVCPLRDVPKFRLNIPVKVFEYWACGLPVVATNLPPIRPFFRDERAGFLIPPGDPDELARAMARLLDDLVEAARMGARGRRFVEERFNNSRAIHKLHDFFTRIATHPVARAHQGTEAIGHA